jgi:GDP-4-dehydro-6-deoxy-D-mannose reductase
MLAKNILITGITGFAGSHVAEYLLENRPGAVLWGTKRPNSRMRNVRQFQDCVRWIDAELTDATSMMVALQKSRPDQIYHLGALSWVTPSWDMPAAYMQTNAIGTINLFEAMRATRVKARVLVSCTPEEFGDVPQDKLPITEDTAIHPINPYAASKVAQDAVCMSYAASYGLKIIRTRAFNHEGPRRDINGANASFAYQIARIEEGLQRPVIRVGNLEALRNFTDVRDMARAYVLAMEKCAPGELYLIGSDYVHTMQECLEYMISLSSRQDIRYEVDPALVRPTELRRFVADCSKFRGRTGWAPRISFHETMQGVLDYWREFVRTLEVVQPRKVARAAAYQ